MSYTDNSREKLLKTYTTGWLPHQANLIYMISKYSVIYVPLPPDRQRRSKLDKIMWDDAWKEISSKLNQNLITLNQLWYNIKYKYVKIMNLINTGKITKMAAMSHNETARYLDGRLSFMDPYLYEIKDEKIPATIHQSINDIFGLETEQAPETSIIKPDKVIITHSQIKALIKRREYLEDDDSDNMDTKSLHMVLDTAVRGKVKELLEIKNTLSEPCNDNVNNNDEHSVNVTTTPSGKLQNVHKSKSHFTLISSDEENTSEHDNIGLQSELILEDEDDVKMEHEDDNLSTDDDVDKIIMQDEDDIKNDEDINKNMEDEDGVREESLAIDMNLNNETHKNVNLGNIVPIILPEACTILGDLNDEISDADLRSFFKELGEVMSLELNPLKQKLLKLRINELLKRILVTEETVVSSCERTPPLRLRN